MRCISLPVTLNYKRLYLLCISILFMFVVLGIRLIYLQAICADKLLDESNKRSLRMQNFSKSRGIITDRMGRILAISMSVNAIWIDPEKIYQSGGIDAYFYKWVKLSKILDISLEKLICIVSNNHNMRFLYLSRQLDPAIAESIIKLKIPGVYSQKELKRYYPAGSAAAHIVGITDIDNRGIEGIEKSFDSWLSGDLKTRVIQQDRSGRIVENVAILNRGRSPKNIVLSIDERLQHCAFYELNKAVNLNKAESGSIVLVDIKTGEILAMANSPSYNPNDFTAVDMSIMRNRAITDAFEPGSTIKPIVVMTALKYNVIDKDAIIDTVPYMIHGHKVKDVLFYNKLTISEILQKSSNVGISKLALAMPISVLVDTYLDFGMGKITNIELLGESKGKIYSYDRYYTAMARAALSYGYGLMITPLQLAKIYTTIGNMGLSRPISILKINNNNNNNISVKRLSENRIFSESLIRTVVGMMEITTNSYCGRAPAAIKGYRVSVKTGTVKKVGPHGKYVNKYISCIAGIAPSSNPRFALVVIINDPKNGHYYGNLVSAPVFRSVMGKALQIMHVTPDFLQ